MGRLAVVLACLLGSCATPVLGQSNPATSPALAALATGDCHRIGEAVNLGIDAKISSALYVAAILYDQGLCVMRNAERANRFYAAASTPGDAAAALEIGIRYAVGDVLPQSYTRAAEWLDYSEHLALNREGIRPLRLPPPSLNEDTEWAGYLTSLHMYAARVAAYPPSFRATSGEADITILICPNGNPVRVALTAGKAKKLWETTLGPSTTSIQSDLMQAAQVAVDQAIAVLPVPQKSATPNVPCAKRQLAFRLR
jgi:hypothetical protein